MRSDRCLALVAVLLVLFSVCAAPLPARAADGGAFPSPVAPVVRASACAGDAELLKVSLTLRPAPDPSLGATLVLLPGTSIYRCEQRGAFLGIMYPEQGGRVDCSMRPPGRECPTGWSDEQLETMTTD